MPESEDYKRGFDAGRNTCSVEGCKRLQENQTEVEDLKKLFEQHEKANNALVNKVLLWLVLFFLGAIGSVFYFGSDVGTLKKTIEVNDARLSQLEATQKDFDKRMQASDVQNAEIRTKLSNIEATILEIKTLLQMRK